MNEESRKGNLAGQKVEDGREFKSFLNFISKFTPPLPSPPPQCHSLVHVQAVGSLSISQNTYAFQSCNKYFQIGNPP